MPSPLEILLDPISLIALALYASLLAAETLFPARALPQISGWRTRSFIAFVSYFYLSTYLPILWDPYLAEFQLFNLQSWGAWSAVAAIAVYELGAYVWHRAMHESDTLFRVVHQMHHSAERLDGAGAFYFSPWDMAGWTLLGSVCTVLIVGPSAEGATIFLLTTFFLGIFQHTNIRTPKWLGYIVQRPESHQVHHARGIHRNNYSDLPVFDLLFGTFENPAEYSHESGFYPGASARVMDMMLGRDVSKPEVSPAPVSQPTLLSAER